MHKDWSKPRQQSPVALLVVFWNTLKALWILLLVTGISFFNKLANPEKKANIGQYLFWYGISLCVILVLLTLPQILRFLYLRLYLNENQLILTSGVWAKKRVEIPFERIQSVHIRQTLFHKLTQTCSLTIDSAGSTEKELELQALALSDALDLQKIIQEKLSVPAPSATSESEENNASSPPAETRWQLTLGDLLKLSLTENHLRTLFIVLAFISGRLQDLREYFGFDSFSYVKEHGSALLATLQSMVVLGISGLLISILISFVLVFIRYWGFTVVQQDKKYALSWGLLETQHRHFPKGRVQFMTWQANWLRRKLGLWMLRFHLLAEANEQRQAPAVVPLATPLYLPLLTADYFHRLPASQSPAVGIQWAYVWRRWLLIGLPIASAGSIALWWLAKPLWWLAPAWLVYFGCMQWCFYRQFRLWIDQNILQVQQGQWGLKCYLFDISTIQTLRIEASVWKRRKGYADLVLALPGETVRLPYLRQNEAHYLADYLLAQIEWGPLEVPATEGLSTTT